MSTAGAAVAGITIAVVAFLLVLTFTCSLCQGYRNSRANAAAHAATAAAVATLAARHPPMPPAAGYWDHDEEQQARRRRAREEHGPPPRASPTASIPSFTYKPSTKHNVTGGVGGEETCSVCLSAFQAGQTVRLLPMCLHLYHVECIDPWLDVQSTCPICRSGIDSPVDGGGLLPYV